MEGQDKLALMFRGERLLGRIARQLGQRFSDLVAVSDRPEALDELGYRVVSDTFKGQGPLAGLHAGLKASRSEWLYLVACDMPFFEPSHVDRLVAAIDRAEASGLRPLAAALKTGPHVEPFQALYRRELTGPLERVLGEPGHTRSIQAFLRSIPVALVDATREDENSFLFFNINTRQALEAAETGSFACFYG